MAQAPLDLLQSLGGDATRVIALSEGSDPRVVAGALAAVQAGVCRVTLVGADADVRAALTAAGGQESDAIAIHDPATSGLTQDFAQAYFDLRKHKGVSPEVAGKAALDPLVYAAMLVRLGHAAGTVGGAVATTSDVVRTALHVIGKAAGASIVSSCFVMLPPTNDGRAMIYADCGLVIDPSSDDLVAIAKASAHSSRALLGQDPKIAMLSFSSKGSARHPKVSLVSDAVTSLQAQAPELDVDGELQFDAAFVPSVAASKAPDSAVAGQANVMVFPNLDAGNIAYKITQRLGGYTAIGPILQGLSKPANDLSRGCVADDVTQMIAVTLLQATGQGDA